MESEKMKGSLKTKASLNNSDTKLKTEAQSWRICDNTDPIRLAWENHHGGLTKEEKVMPVLDEEYIEKSIDWHMYLAQTEQHERK